MKVYSVLFYLLGLFAGMNSLCVMLGSIDMTFFTFILMLLVLIKMFFENKIKLDKKEINSPIFIYLVLLVVSTLINVFLIEKAWVQANIIFTISTVVGVLGYYILFSREEKQKYFEPFFNGLKINCVIQVIWTYLQFVFMEYFSLSLNSMLGLKRASSSLIAARQVTGLGWERAELCFTLTLGYLIYKNPIFKLLFAIGIVLTQSRTGIVMLVIAMIASIDYKKLIHKIKKMKLSEVCLLIIALAIVIGFRETIHYYIFELVARFDDLMNDASGRSHLLYYIRIPELVKSVPLINLLFGYGPASSGYPYTIYYEKNIDLIWNIESSWLTCLWGVGMIGFLCWFVWFIKNIVYYINKNKKIFALFCAIFFGGVLYSLLPNWGLFVMIVFSFVNIDTLNKNIT